MANATRPSIYPDWTQGLASQISGPSPALQASGWSANDRPTYQVLNWLFYQQAQWIEYLDQVSNSTVLGATLDPLVRLVGGGLWSYNATSNTLSWSQPFFLSVPGINDAVNTVAAGSISLSPGQCAYFNANVPFTTTGNVTSGSSQITNLAFELGIQPGQTISGPGIPNSTTVVSVSGTTCNISASATATSTASSLTFVATAAISVQAANTSSLAPSVNTVILARAATGSPSNYVIVGVNSGEMVVRDGEQKMLLASGFGTVTMGTAGVALSSLNFAYMSVGAADSSRTAGQIYLADASIAQGQFRANCVGVVVTAAASGAPVGVVSSGFVGGFSGLLPGTIYYLDPNNPGAITATKPTTVNQWVVAVGTATSASTLMLNPAMGESAYQVTSINPWPQYAAATEAQLQTALSACASGGGGVIVLTANFSISSNYTVSWGTVLQGRKGGAVVTVNQGASFLLGDGSEMRDVMLTAGATPPTYLVQLPNSFAIIRGCIFTAASTTTTTCAYISGTANHLYDNQFNGVMSGTATGVQYAQGATDNYDNGSVFVS